MLYKWILLDEKILESYGLCPYLDSDEKTRLWLENQDDKGYLYNYFKEKIVDGKDVEKQTGIKKSREDWFDNYLNSRITGEHLESFTEIIQYFNNFSKNSVKTKLAKARYNLVINNLFHLCNVTQTPIYNYINAKYGTNIQHPITYVQTKHTKEFNEHVVEYKSALLKLKQACKYRDNRQQFLVDAYTAFIESNENVYKGYTIIVKQKPRCIGEKWSKLTKEDRLERIYSFLQSKMSWYSDDVLADLVNQIYSLYECKKIVYTQFKWNSRLGLIRDINGVNIKNGEVSITTTTSPKRQEYDEEKVLEEFKNEINEQILYNILVNKSVTLDELCTIFIRILRVEKLSRNIRKYIKTTLGVFTEIIEINKFDQ